MNRMTVEKLHPFDRIHFLHNFPAVYLPHEDVGFIRRKAHNIYRKAVHAGKWQNFAAGIGTGAAYASLHGLHWHPHWITIIELILFLINVVIFSVNLILLSINILSHLKGSANRSHLIDSSTPLIAPLVVLDYGTICIGIMLYSHELGALVQKSSLQGLFWSYLSLSVIVCGPMTFVWFGWGKSLHLRSFSMTGAFLVFPLMLVGTIAFNTLAVIEPTSPSALSIWILGYIFQGLGMAIAYIFITVHFYRAIRYGFHRGAAAGSTFISVGPPGFTALTILQLGSLGRKILPLHTPLPQEAADMIYYTSIPMALCLVGVALYCWVFAMVPWICTFTKHIMYNPAGAWPLTFPCTGFTLTLGLLGNIFESHAFWILQAFFTGYICLAFLLLFPCWLYRIVVPPDPELLAARSKYFEEAYDQLNFWGSIRMAEEAEHQYIANNGNKDRDNEGPSGFV